MKLADHGFVAGIYKTLNLKDNGRILSIRHLAKRI
jgi:hypothetical protein